MRRDVEGPKGKKGAGIPVNRTMSSYNSNWFTQREITFSVLLDRENATSLNDITSESKKEHAF